ncbi:MAG: outer membrane protein assembly factor BamA [Sedimentisphaerales bacterium]|nr:outer membrane protein assembly factor BamA [Sedimentisphaerales bacterium]
MTLGTAGRKTQGMAWIVISILLFGVGWCSAQEPSQVNLESLRIGSIEVSGNVSLGRADILSSVRARTGELFDTASVEEDIKRLARLEGVEYAYYNTAVADGQIKLTYVVVERNLVREIVFIGNKHFKDVSLTKELGFKVGDYLDAFQAGAAVEAIAEKYQSKGYAFVEVILDEAKMNRGRVEYAIQEGPRVKVKDVRFRGNQSLESEELKKVIKTRTRKFLFWSVDYTKEKLEADVLKLQEAYLKAAFLNAAITTETEFLEDRTGTIVTFVIDEGREYIVRQITFQGNTYFDEDTLRQNLKLVEDNKYTPQRAERDIKEIRDLYLAEGFVDAAVTHRRSFVGDSQVDVDFEIVEGRRFKIGRIDIAGNETIKDNVFRHVLDEEGFTPGQWYNAEIARGDGKGDLETIVRRTTITQSAKITPAPPEPDSDLRSATLSVIEGQTGSIMFGAGVASDSGVMGQIVYDQRNFDISDWPENLAELIHGKAFKGAGQQFRISLNPGTVVSTWQVSFTEPYLYDLPVSFEVGGYGFERWRESYDEDRTKAYVTLEKRYQDDWRRGISFRAENVKVTDLEWDTPRQVRDDEGSNTLFGARFFFRKDTTDNRYTPSSGYNFTAGYEQVVGDYTFGIVSATQRWYRTVYEDLAERKTVLETKLYGAGIVGGDAPVYEKFYAGGTGSIRGFDYRGVSPRGLQYNPYTPITNPERKDPIGSDWILTGNVELAVPLESDVLSWLFFVDAGAVDTGGVRASVGTGIQILLPQWFGPVPMRFEIAAPFMKESEDETRTFSFSVGALF